MATATCVIDTSAIVAIYADEPETASFREMMRGLPFRMLPVCCYVEFCLLHRLEGDRQGWLDAFIKRLSIKIPPMTLEIGIIAAAAALRYGRGSGNTAGLNFGDCMSYAHAIHFNAPLLFKGNDFIHTDVQQISPGH